MLTEPRIPLQPFTRVHLVPGVNGTAAAALVFERDAQEPWAVSLPLAVLGQVFGVLPQVMAKSRGAEVESSAPLLVPTPWALDGFELQETEANGCLLMSVQGVQLQLQLDRGMLSSLADELGQLLKPKSRKSTAKKVAKDSAVQLPKQDEVPQVPVKRAKKRMPVQ